MTDIPIYGGPTKRSIIQRAYGLCGQSTAEFELSADDYELGLAAMTDLAATIGSTLNYNFPNDDSLGSPEEESGLARDDVLGFTVMLAQEIGPSIGKAYGANATQANAKSAVLARHQVIPSMMLGRQTIRGAGNRWRGRFFGPFFWTPAPTDETPQ